MANISKKQRSALREITTIAASRKRDLTFGIGSLFVMVLIILAFNTFGYNLEWIDPNNIYIRAMMYVTALVFAGYSGIKFMNASKKQRHIDGLRQQTGISKDTLEAWKRGEIE